MCRKTRGLRSTGSASRRQYPFSEPKRPGVKRVETLPSPQSQLLRLLNVTEFLHHNSPKGGTGSRRDTL